MTSNHYVSRAIQIDSQQLDAQFVDLIATHIAKLKIYSFDRFASELNLIFQIYLWYKKHYLSNNSIGLELFKLKFCNTQNALSNGSDLKLWQKCTFLYQAVFTYLYDRFGTHLDLKQRILIDRLTAAFSLLQTVNSFLFIYGGTYRSLEERLFRIQIKPLNSSTRLSQTTFSFLNRELLWHSLSQVLTLLLPNLLCNNRFNHTIEQLVCRLGPSSAASQNLSMGQREGSTSNCCICQQAPINATTLRNCAHIYCYYCVASHLMSHSSFRCRACKTHINSLSQLSHRFVL